MIFIPIELRPTVCCAVDPADLGSVVIRPARNDHPRSRYGYNLFVSTDNGPIVTRNHGASAVQLRFFAAVKFGASVRRVSVLPWSEGRQTIDLQCSGAWSEKFCPLLGRRNAPLTVVVSL